MKHMMDKETVRTNRRQAQKKNLYKGAMIAPLFVLGLTGLASANAASTDAGSTKDPSAHTMEISLDQASCPGGDCGAEGAGGCAGGDCGAQGGAGDCAGGNCGAEAAAPAGYGDTSCPGGDCGAQGGAGDCAGGNCGAEAAAPAGYGDTSCPGGDCGTDAAAASWDGFQDWGSYEDSYTPEQAPADIPEQSPVDAGGFQDWGSFADSYAPAA